MTITIHDCKFSGLRCFSKAKGEFYIETSKLYILFYTFSGIK